MSDDSTSCACCKHSDIAGPRGESGYPLARGTFICSFCKLLFPAIVPPDVDLSNTELIGAWADFTEDIRDYECNVSMLMRHARLAFNDLRSDCLQAWITESTLPSAAQEQALRALWPLTAFNQVLDLMEVAVMLGDEYDHQCDTRVIMEVIEREEVAPVWRSWLASNVERGKACDRKHHPNKSWWAFYGEAHIERCAERAVATGREVATRRGRGL